MTSRTLSASLLGDLPLHPEPVPVGLPQRQHSGAISQ